METMTTKEERFNEIIKAFHPKEDDCYDPEETMLFYYYNLEYTGKREEEHKLDSWKKWLK